MEFDNIFTAIQGRLLSAQKSLNTKLVDIIKGLPEECSEALKIIKNALEELNLPKEYKRKVHLLFLLNSSFYSCTFIENDRNFCHIIGAIPKISDYLYFNLVVQLDWHEFLGETLLYCPEILITDVLRFIELNLDLLDSSKGVQFFYSLYENLYKKIIVCDCKYRRQKIVKYLLNLLKFDFQVIVDQMEHKKEVRNQYWGYVNRMYLQLTEFCVRFMAEPVTSQPEIYCFTLEYDYTKWPNATSETNWGRHCLGVIATKTVESIKKINVNMYMSWCEIDLPDPAAGKTLQTSVREAAYTCREAIRSIANLYDYISGLRSLDMALESIALRPITEDEEVAAADPNTLVINILNPKRTQVKWLRGLIERGIFESAPYMKVVIDNARLIDQDTCQLLLNKAVQYISSNSIMQTDLALIRETVFSCLRAISLNDQMQLLERFSEEYGQTNILTSDNFESTVIGLLNKIVSDSNRSPEVYKDTLCLAFENSEVLLSICLRECLTSKQKSDLIVEMLQYIKPVFSICYRGTTVGLTQTVSLITSVSKGGSDQERETCLRTVTSLCQKSLLDGKKLLNDHIVPLFDSSLLEKELQCSIFYQEIIMALTQIEDYSSMALVVLIAKSMNRLRPKITSFTMKAVHFTSASSKLLTSLIDRFLRDKNCEEDNEVKWLRGVASCLSPLTCRYMSQLWCKWGKEPPVNRDDPTVYSYLYGLGKGSALSSLDQKQRFAIVSAVVKVLPQLIISEWEEIGCTEAPHDKKDLTVTTLSVFFILADCILILFQLPFMIQNPSCLGHTLTNFLHYCQVHILRTNLLKVLNEEQKTNIQDKIDQIAHQLPEALIKSKMPYIVHLQKSISDSDISRKSELLN